MSRRSFLVQAGPCAAVLGTTCADATGAAEEKPGARYETHARGIRICPYLPPGKTASIRGKLIFFKGPLAEFEPARYL